MSNSKLEAEAPILSLDRVASKIPKSISIRNQVRRAEKNVQRISFGVRLVSVWGLMASSLLQQPFDTSAELVALGLDPQNQDSLVAGPFRWLMSFVRWDTVYFVSLANPISDSTAVETSLALGGYTHEQMLAFQPGIVTLLRLTGYTSPDMSWSPSSAILLTTLAANIASTIAPVLLFRLTMAHTRSLSLATTSAILSTLSPSGGSSLASPATEPFFSIFSLLGMLSLAPIHDELQNRSSFNRAINRLKAAVCFGLATSFRANGVLLSGFLIWDLFWNPSSTSFNSLPVTIFFQTVKAMVLVMISMSPFILFQMWSYDRFCLNSLENLRPWCQSWSKSVYPFVQSEYWQVGLLRYWKPSQLVNFVFAAPMIFLAVYGVYHYFSKSTLQDVIFALIPFRTRQQQHPQEKKKEENQINKEFNPNLFTTPTLLPYYLLTVFSVLLLVFASHVQIVLRFASPGGMPVIWWSTASLWHSYRNNNMQQKNLDSWILKYLCIWYCVAIVLYAGFYPPA